MQSLTSTALIHLTPMLATTFAETRVRVNSINIAPGTFPSEMTTGSSGPDQKSTLTREASNVSGRAGQETDMAATISFLAGRGGVFYNDQFLFPDGGELFDQPSCDLRVFCFRSSFGPSRIGVMILCFHWQITS